MSKTLKDIAIDVNQLASDSNLSTTQFLKSYLKEKRGVIIEFLRDNNLSGTANNTENAIVSGQILTSKITDWQTLTLTPISDVTVEMVGSPSALKLLKKSPSAFYACVYLMFDQKKDTYDPDFLDPISIVSGIGSALGSIFGGSKQEAPQVIVQKEDNTGLYIAIGGGVLLIVAALFILRK